MLHNKHGQQRGSSQSKSDEQHHRQVRHSEGVVCGELLRSLLFLTAVNLLFAQLTLETNFPIDGFHPLKISSCSRVSPKYDVHLLKRQSLGLRDVEPDESGAHKREETKYDVGAVCDTTKHIWCDLADNEIVHPVEGGT